LAAAVIMAVLLFSLSVVGLSVVLQFVDHFLLIMLSVAVPSSLTFWQNLPLAQILIENEPLI
jgi:hypothetical protein